MKPLLFIVAFIAVAGCASRPAPTVSPVAVAPDQSYANANNRILTEFGATLKRLAARPVVKPLKTVTKPERREMLAKQMEPIGGAAITALAKLDRLTPPPATRDIHNATRALLVTYRDNNVALVAAIRRGDRKQVATLGDKSDADSAAAFVKLRATLIDALIREGKTPEQAQELTKNVAL